MAAGSLRRATRSRVPGEVLHRLPFDGLRGPYRRRIQVLGTTGQQLRDKVETHEEAGFHVGEGEMEVGQMRDEKHVVQEDGPHVG